ncbi:MAG: 3'-5' exonuclease domain-containing protein 2 [Cyclobacteriaceae bacterium]|nr:3'-5' exonuclease domain-containing protein 2 [Cyclobacteriaceae bacterium]
MTKPPLKSNISNEELNELPLGMFTGKVVVVQEAARIKKILPELYDQEMLGFDTETKPVFVRGHSNKVALLQLALPEKVFLIRLQQTGMTDELAEFLESAAIEKAGVAIRDDLVALKKLRSFNPGGFVEITHLTKSVGLEAESVKKLTGLLLGFRISKSAQTSNWEAPTLTEKQIQYAATDAWVCLEIFRRLRALR